MKTDKYYGYAQPVIPDNNKGNIVNGVFYSNDDKAIEGGYYKRQMAANEFKDYIGPRVLANNERPEDEQLDPRIIDTANFILQHQEKMKQRLRDKYRKNNIAFKKKLDNVVRVVSQNSLAYALKVLPRLASFHKDAEAKLIEFSSARRLVIIY